MIEANNAINATGSSWKIEMSAKPETMVNFFDRGWRVLRLDRR